MATLLIKNGFIVTEDEVIKGDLLIEDEIIKEISDFIDVKATRTIDAKGNVVFPGSIDAHTHMELPIKDGFSSDSFETGTLAALYGGTTTIIDFANQKKGGSLDQALKKWHDKAKDNCYTDYKFHVAVTDVRDSVLSEMKNFYDCQGIKSFKTFLAYPHMEILPEDLKRVMAKAKEVGAITTLHAETGHIVDQEVKKLCESQNIAPSVHHISRPVSAEEDAISQAIYLAEETDSTLYIVHLTSKRGLDLIRDAKERGVKVLAETCPQYLLLTDALYSHDNPEVPLKYILSPPLRKKRRS